MGLCRLVRVLIFPIKFVFCIFLVLWPCFVEAVLYDGVHTHCDYLNVPKDHKIYDAACGVYDRVKNTSASGVLVAPNVVATAAHVVEKLISDDMRKTHDTFIHQKVFGVYVAFSKHETYAVEEVIIHRRFLEEAQNGETKFDIAFLKLKKWVKNRPVAKIADEFQLPKDFPYAVAITHGTSDLPHFKGIIRRGFYLYELSEFIVGREFLENVDVFGSASYSSIFFDPKTPLKMLSIHDDADDQRVQYALQSYQKNPKPTGLALPGTSGSPVFVEVTINGEKQFVLFGLVTSYSPLHNDRLWHLWKSEHEILIDDPAKAKNKYQTNISIFYQQSFLNSSPLRGTTFRDSGMGKFVKNLS